ncbi:MAG: EscU/YscU/HrcU family type III secretion system export apparatus switch protein, partial [Planctomycetes bacterium]|nr:EscU/YscU/HrcU family type III secretion system export apparatus switch protein [Planctomycetota bacterium]
MGLLRDDDGKTEDPTPTRLAEVQKRGDTPLSKELVQGGVLVIAAIALRWCGGWLIETLGALLRSNLQVDPGRRVDSIGAACQSLAHAATTVALPLGLLFVLLVGATLLFGYGQIGVHWAGEAVGWKLERVNPFTNFRRVLNPQSLARTAFAALKLLVLLLVLWLALGHRWPELLMLHER